MIEDRINNLCSKIDAVLSGDKSLIKSNNIQQKEEIEFFNTINGNKLEYTFLIPFAKKENVKAFIKTDPDNDELILLSVEYKPEVSNLSNYRLKDFSYFKNKKVVLSLVKDKFDFDNVITNFDQGIFQITLMTGNSDQKKKEDLKFNSQNFRNQSF